MDSKIENFRRNREYLRSRNAKVDLKPLLENALGVAVIITIAVIIAGTSFDLGYFLNLGIEMQYIPISSTEYLTTLISYLPRFVLFLLIILPIIFYSILYKPKINENYSVLKKTTYLRSLYWSAFYTIPNIWHLLENSLWREL